MATNNSINSVIIGSAEKAAFGEMLAVSISPIVQLQFPYNINTAYVGTALTGVGTVSVVDGMASIASGAAIDSGATMTSNYRLDYQPGQGAVALFTGLFSEGVVGNTQLIGVGNETDGFFFGYNGTSFGILFRSSSSGSLVDTWIPQASWNQDKFDGVNPSTILLDTLKGNVFKIQYQWLGFGAIKFFIENPLSGAFQLCHIIQYSNANVYPTIRNPSLQLLVSSINTTNATSVSTKTASMCAAIEGITNSISSRFSTGHNKSIGGVITNIFTLRNNTTFQGVTNQVTTYPQVLSIYNSSNPGNDGMIYVYRNSTLGGTPSYTDINADTSVTSFDIAGTTITGGNEEYRFFIGATQTLSIDLQSNLLRMAPGDTLTFAGQSISGTSVLHAGMSWVERF